jgi:hypothetical protein
MEAPLIKAVWIRLKIKHHTEGVSKMPGKGLYANIHAKRKRIKAQKKRGKTPERMRKPGSKGAPTKEAFRKSKLTARNK